MTGKPFSEEEAASFTRGAAEEDLVNSGLEETMVQAYHEIREHQRRWDAVDLRTASLVDAIQKIALAYKELGIFP